MSKFKPLGAHARWRIIYDELLVHADHGDVFTFAQIATVLNLDPIRDLGSIRSAVRRASEEFIDEKGRALVTERGVGYRVAEPSTHVVLAHRQQKRSANALERGHALAARVDLSNVEPAVRHALEMIASGFALQMDFNRRFDVRQRHLEEALETTRRQQTRTDEEVAKLRERLEQLEDHIQ